MFHRAELFRPKKVSLLVMTSQPRYLPEGGALVEVTCRTIQGRFLLRPSSELEEIVAGVLARAYANYPVDIVAVTCLSNHVHLLLRPETQFLLSMFMGFFKRNVTKEVNRLHGWEGPAWHGRYKAIPVEDRESVQVARFRYLLAQGVKEHLVSRVVDWPGLHFGKTLLRGKTELRGIWINRTAECRARNQRQQLSLEDLREPEVVPLAKLPCWAHLSWSEYRRRVQDLVMEIEATATAERRAQGLHVVGAGKVAKRHPHTRPGTMEKTHAPRFHAESRQSRIDMYRAYGEFLGAYREAANRLKKGVAPYAFPEGCFPPALPYVGVTGLPPDSS